MTHSEYIKSNVFKRFSEHHSRHEETTSDKLLTSDRPPDQRLRQFFTIARNRKRQILERMLLD